MKYMLMEQMAYLVAMDIMQIYLTMISNPQPSQNTQMHIKEKNDIWHTSPFNSPLTKCGHKWVARSGFTLVELIVVIFLISFITALIMPSFWSTGEKALRSESKRVGNTLRYIYDEAIGKKQIYVVKIDLDKAAWEFASNAESRSFHLEKDIVFKDILIPSHGEISGGEVSIEFGPLGPEEPLTIHLMKNEHEYTVIFNHLNGRVKIIKGYVL